LALRQEGHSYRAIAGALGVSHVQVINDVKSTAKQLAVELPERTVGLDGKSRPARRRLGAFHLECHNLDDLLYRFLFQCIQCVHRIRCGAVLSRIRGMDSKTTAPKCARVLSRA
jgi:hypothetical protein